MNSSYENNQALFIAIICLIVGIYEIWTGFLAITGRNPRIPGFYHLGIQISNLIRGQSKTSKFEEEMSEPTKAIRYGVFWLVIGLIFTVAGLYLLFGKY